VGVVIAMPVRLMPGARGQVPVYGYPEAAVGALARAARYGAWRAETRGHVPDFAESPVSDVRGFLDRISDGG
jgi:acyl-CoA synthetase (NDP forming)